MAQSVCACCGESNPARTVQLLSHREISICFGCLDWLNGQRDRKRAAVEPVRIAHVDPIFAVADLDRSRDHYQKMGFSTSEGSAADAFARRGDLTIRLAPTGDSAVASGASIYLHVDDADELARSWRLAGLEIVGPDTTERGQREGSHRDPDRNLVRFGSPARAAHQV